MAMHNPPRPGEFIRETYIEPFDLSIRSLAENPGVAASTLARVVAERSAVSPEMALRLSKALGRSPESWLAMQDNYDLWQARKSVNLSKVRKVRFAANAWYGTQPLLSELKIAPKTEYSHVYSRLSQSGS